MSIIKKSREEIKLMKIAGHIVALCHKKVKQIIEPGINTLEINDQCNKIIKENKAIPTFLNYKGYPYSICASINHEVVHGFPSKDKILKEGDIISIDIGATYRGLVGDSAWTYGVGKIDSKIQNLLNITQKALYNGINEVRNNVPLKNVSKAIEKTANDNNLGIVRYYGGHGVGRNMHEDPFIYNWDTGGNDKTILKNGMTIAIEPMFNLGSDDVYTQEDGWTVVTKDFQPSAHFEHTVLVCENEAEILTKVLE